MSELSAALERYFDAFDSLGVQTHKRLGPPATPAELDRLAEAVGTDLPPDLREWFTLVNGLDTSKLPYSAETIFPGRKPLSATEATEAAIAWRTPGTLQNGTATANALTGEDALIPSVWVMIATHDPYIDFSLLVDCADHPGRVVTFTIETGDSDSGFYHNSITDLLQSLVTNIERGFYIQEHGELVLNAELFDNARDRRVADPNAPRIGISRKLASWGFVADGPTPPRLSGWPTRSWDYRF